MPNKRYIQAGDETAVEKPFDLAAAKKELASLEKQADEFRTERFNVRQTIANREDKLAELAKTEGPFNEVLDRITLLQKEIGRAENPDSGPGQAVAVGTAKESNKAGGK